MDPRRPAADVPLVENGNHDDVVDAGGPKQPGAIADEYRQHAKPGIVVAGREGTRVHADGRSSERLRHLHAAAGWGSQTAGILADQVLGGLTQVRTEWKMGGLLVE